MLDINKVDYQLGLVKWFGGYNHQKGRENDFGFIQTMNRDDVFVHRNEIHSGIDLFDDELVVFEIGERNGKSCANNVYSVRHDTKIVETIIKLYIKFKETHTEFFDSYTFKSSFKNLLNEQFIQKADEKLFLELLLIIYDEDYQFLFNKLDLFFSTKENLSGKALSLFIDNIDNFSFKAILQSSILTKYLSDEIISEYIKVNAPSFLDQLSNLQITNLIKDNLINIESAFTNPSYINYAFENYDDHKIFFSLLVKYSKENFQIYELIKNTYNWSGIFRKLVGRQSLKTLLNNGLPFNYLPHDFINKHEDNLFIYIKSLKEKDDFFDNNIKHLPKNIVLASIIEKLLVDEDLIFLRQTELKTIIENRFREKDQDLPDYVTIALDSLFDNIDDYDSISPIRLLLEPMFFKKFLYEKNTNTKQFFDQSISLSKFIDHFILANLFPLIQANNSIDISFKVFLHNLWESLKTKKIDISDVDLFNLFPSCSTMGYNELSCEAFYWPKNENFLCRGKLCNDPQVLPNTDKHYLHFNIYDWFKHYGIDYTNEGNPAKKDFPIKLAGYFNRLKELFEIIQCRECNTLMLPDMRYARVEYYEYDPDKDKYVKKNTSAAYRVTVFECANSSCDEFEEKYYINHCLGFGCYSVIDTRDLKLKCDGGLYICRNCGSCCEQCAKNHPNGFCPDCGNPIILYEKNGNRFVYCSKRDCDFKISEENLTKKFLLPSAPVKRVGNSNNSNSYQNYTEPDYDDLPF